MNCATTNTGLFVRFRNRAYRLLPIAKKETHLQVVDKDNISMYNWGKKKGGE